MKGKALENCGAGLVMERAWRGPAGQAAAFVPIWDLLTNAFFWPGLTERAACSPSQQPTAAVSFLGYSPTSWHISLQM